MAYNIFAQNLLGAIALERELGRHRVRGEERHCGDRSFGDRQDRAHVFARHARGRRGRAVAQGRETGATEEIGARRGDKLILLLSNNEQFIDAYWAGVLGGIVPVPVAPGISEEHRHKLLRIARKLGDPYIYSDRKTLDRIASFADQAGEAETFRKLRARAFLVDDLDDISKPGKMRFEYKPPSTVLVVSDGIDVAVFTSSPEPCTVCGLIGSRARLAGCAVPGLSRTTYQVMVLVAFSKPFGALTDAAG